MQTVASAEALEQENLQNQQIPPEFQNLSAKSEVIVDAVDDNRLRVVLYVGDMTSLRDKQVKQYSLGGRHTPEAMTVPGKFLVRCALTPLAEAMLGVSKNLVHPDERKNYIQAYRKTNVFNPATGRFEDLVVGASGASKDLIFKKIFPAREVGQIAYQQPADGTIEIEGLRTIAELKAVQLHYFPNWNQILSGKEKLPATNEELKAHIIERQAMAPQGSVLWNVGEKYLLACDQYALWGKGYLERQTAVVEEAKKKPGAPGRYSEEAESLFKQLGLTRQDALVEVQAAQAKRTEDKVDKIGDAVGLLAQIVANQEAAKIQPQPQQQQQQTPPNIVQNPPIAQTCGDLGGTKGDGSPCGKPAVNGVERCAQHPATPETPNE